ncbi:flagellar basal body-associated FliL family protein [Alicyclobacillus cycloheptanicus]|jgi:flagellar FliL protein|uniref:Flagellar protein FliL n=1 Tax=Alicyclobacillus cycloheptanicus TaxID=1457 RepID=A0ABT9XK96_9BACL|nr:flagellar basal body-associated FliL family protein [Alicyclobacillus cycloheptanicus]MDQ0190550.1 flagellar FliL protein [Alicyclobacillus cycloheptanicus]WDM01392.1 flagellar basal body-associated FliL family protein [Alicyclobacillus cycloheptanicus]
MNKTLKLSLSLIGAIAVVLALGVGADRYLKSKHHSSKPAALSPAQLQSLQVSLPQMTTNLKGSGLIQFTLTLQADNSSTKSELTDLMPQIEDYVNETMRAYTPDSLEQQSGVTALKKQLRSGINHMLPTGSVTNVLFTSIVVQ